MDSYWTTPAQLLAYPRYLLLRTILSVASRAHRYPDNHARLIRIQPRATAQRGQPRIIRLVQEMARAGDLIVIDLRPPTESPLIKTVPAALPVSSEDLVTALGCLPLQRDVEVCVAASDCIFLLDRRSCMRVSGQADDLKEILTRLEAA